MLNNLDMPIRMFERPRWAPHRPVRGAYRWALTGALGRIMDPSEPGPLAPTDNDCRLPVDPISGGNRESCDSSNTYECAFGISEMTDDKSIR
jgi:hypothetical protein